MKPSIEKRGRAQRRTARLHSPFENYPNDGLLSWQVVSDLTNLGKTKIYETFEVRNGAVRVGSVRDYLAKQAQAA